MRYDGKKVLTKHSITMYTRVTLHRAFFIILRHSKILEPFQSLARIPQQKAYNTSAAASGVRFPLWYKHPRRQIGQTSYPPEPNAAVHSGTLRLPRGSSRS